MSLTKRRGGRPPSRGRAGPGPWAPFALWVVALGALATAGPARAQLICGPPSCSISSPALAFGSAYDPFAGTVLDANTTLTVSCTQVALLVLCSVSYAISLDPGAAGTYAPRRLSSGPAGLDYNIYADGARSLVWGDGTAGTTRVGGTITFPALIGGTRTRNHTAYGRVFAGQPAGAGVYTDTVTMTLAF